MFRSLSLTPPLGPGGESPGAGIDLDPSKACIAQGEGPNSRTGCRPGSLGPVSSVKQTLTDSYTE